MLSPLATMGRRLGLTLSDKDAIALLESDHRTVEKLFGRFKKARSARDRGRVGAQICRELTIHTQLEEKLFYPEARKHLRDEIMINEAVVEHTHLKELVRDLKAMKPGNAMYQADMKVLIDYVKHHVKEEERELFPKLRSTPMDMDMIGEKMMAMKQRLMRKTNGNGHARLNGKTPHRGRPSARTKRSGTKGKSARGAHVTRH
jgi:hemerythrin superfamily protein